MLQHTTVFWILSIYVAIGVTVGSDEPENVAVNSGERSNFTCKTKTTSKLRWSMRLVGENDERILTREGQILPAYAGNYTVQASTGQLILIVKHTSLHDAGKYICLELSSSKTFSAELIVIESEPECETTKNKTSYVHICDVKYRGNWRPDIDLRIPELKEVDMKFYPERVIGRLDVPSYQCPESEPTYACTAKFSQNGKKTFEGENVNDVIGTVARNIPEYSKRSDCRNPTNCGFRAHLATSLSIISCVILASRL